jgi:NADH:ubiquinone oxidoreductase subunit 6 (subunit J)
MQFLATISSLPFYILATISIVCALGMILNPNLVRAGFTLIGTFIGIAGLYFLLNANFVAVSQVLIYAVGIVLVIVFAVMLCSLKEEAHNIKESVFSSKARVTFAVLISSLVFAVLSFVIRSQDWQAIAKLTGAERQSSLVQLVDDKYLSQIGFLMLNKYILPFELVSVLLLIVLVGTILLSKKDIK